jgi:4'-phosphopantetheinyl transferase
MAVPETTRDDWPAPRGELSLTGEEVHVWRASLECPEPILLRLRRTLTHDEEARARRFHFKKDRNHYAAARGLLRLILSSYAKCPPEALRFGYSPYGKPFLESECGPGGLRFNVSHSHGMALFAVARGREVGVDIEFMRDDLEYMEIAAGFFSPREVATLGSLPPEMRAQAFFNCWTRKEAYIKARGEGLSHPLHDFDVTLAPGEEAALTYAGNDPLEVNRWSMRALSPRSGFRAAVVVEGGDFNLSLWQWREP